MARALGYFSSGIYDKETDLTIVTNQVANFSIASVSISEKGPAFEIVQIDTFGDYSSYFGNLNPEYKNTYLAKQYLEQAGGLKQVRVLGLDGYKDTKAFVIQYDIPGASPATLNGSDAIISPLVATTGSVVAILKERRNYGKTVNFVEVREYTDPLTSTTSATDDKFVLYIEYSDATFLSVICSLREDSREYLPKLFGTQPLQNKKLFDDVAPLWVDFIIPSKEQKLDAVPTIIRPKAYYYPGDTTPLNQLNILQGVTDVDTSFTYTAYTLMDITNASPIVIQTSAAHGLTSGDLVSIDSVLGNTNANGIHYVDVVDSTHFELYSDESLTTPISGNGAWTSGSGNVRKHYVAGWEKDFLDLDAIEYRTPSTPWFVSDIDNNGHYKKLFRLWTISDGEHANRELKLEIADIDYSGNFGAGSFTLYVKSFDAQEDKERGILEAWANLSLDPNSDNYILKVIGDGDEEELRSSYILVELNNDIEPEDLIGELPFGIEGYTISTGKVMEDIVWTTEYNLSSPIAKQTLGFANNNVNMFKVLNPEKLNFRNCDVTTLTVGKGFHLNENADTNKFVCAPQTLSTQLDSDNNPLLQFVSNPSENKKRLKFTVPFYGGFDGFDVYKQREWGNTTSKDYEAFVRAIDLLNDRESLLADFTLLVTPDLTIENDEAAMQYALEMVETRSDALYIPDFAYDKDVIIQSQTSTLDSSSLKSSYSAVYTPYAQIKDVINNKNIWVAPSIIAVSTIAYIDQNIGVGQPPAGTMTVTNDIIRTRRRIKLDEREELKKSNINPITIFPGVGLEITESRTTQPYFSALSFIHNRLLISYAKKTLNQLLHPLLHKLNNDVSSQQFINTVQPVFDRLKKKYRIADFNIYVQDVPEDKVTLYGIIEIVLLYPIERIVIDYTLKNNAFEFSVR